jgi:hypothetical protein
MDRASYPWDVDRLTDPLLKSAVDQSTLELTPGFPEPSTHMCTPALLNEGKLTTTLSVASESRPSRMRRCAEPKFPHEPF